MASKSRRRVLENVKLPSNRPTHAGLWLDRYLVYQTRDPRHENVRDAEILKRVQTARAKLVGQAATVETGLEYYYTAHSRAERLKNAREGVKREVRLYTTQGRCIIGLGQEGVIEAGITLNHTWGTPILPGSSLKGVAAAAAHLLADDASWRKAASRDAEPGESFTRLFGSTAGRGLISFHDAWWLPDNERPTSFLAPDVLTVHHPSYYQKEVEDADFRPPDGMDSPIPVSFITLRPNLTFAIVLEAREEDEPWLEAAWRLLDEGLLTLGIGAKSNAGYGRLVQKTGDIITMDDRELLKKMSDGNGQFSRKGIENAIEHARTSNNRNWVLELVATLSKIRKNNTDTDFRSFINPILKEARARASELKPEE